MSIHNKNINEHNRLVLVCGTIRIEIFTNISLVEWCPVCGDKIERSTFVIRK
jgi:hypothetical protein